MSEQIEATSIEHTKGYIPIVHLSDGSSISLNELVEQAMKWRHAKSPGAVDRAMNLAEHADQMRVSAEKRAAEAESAMRAAQAGERQSIRDAVRLPKVIEQAGAWKRRALAAESDLELAREQARYRESELVRSGHQQLFEAQANALDTIQRIAAQLPVDPIIDAEVVVPDVEVDTWFGEDDTPVVQIDTHRGHGRLRINLNDGVVWDGDPETDERPGAYAEALPSDRSLTVHIGGQQGMKATISRQLDTIRDQAEKIEQLEEQLRLAVQHGVEHEARTREAEDKAETLARRMDHNVRSFRALEARKVELEAEVLAARGALAVCQAQLTDAKAALAESERAFSAIDAARVELAAQLKQARDGIDRQAGEINETASARDWWKAEHAAAVKRINDANDAKAEAIAHCNEQLQAITAAAKLREGHVHQLARLIDAAFARRPLPFGPILTRALHTVLADHGVDVSEMPGAGPVTAQAVAPDQRLVTEHAALAHQHRQLTEAAQQVAYIGIRNTGDFLSIGLRNAIKEMNGLLLKLNQPQNSA